MRNAVAAALAAVLSMGTAHAGDLHGSSLKDMPVPVGCTMCWGGLYVGSTLGLGVGDTEEKYIGYDIAYLPDYFDMNGQIYGINIDYNIQSGSLVFGVEASINGTTMDGHYLDPYDGYDYKRKLDWYGAVTGRLGYAPGNIMYYSFVGPAWGEVKTTRTDYANITPVDTNDSATHFGWTAGVGLEWAFNDCFTARIEYAHIDLGSKTILDEPAYHGHHKADLEFDAIKIGASYKLRGREDRMIETPLK